MIGIAQENGYKHYIWNSQFYQSCDEILWCQYDEYLFEQRVFIRLITEMHRCSRGMFAIWPYGPGPDHKSRPKSPKS